MSEAAKIEALEQTVERLTVRVASLERIEKYLDEQDRKQRSNVQKQNESLVQNQEIEKRMRTLSKLPGSQIEEIERMLREQERNSGKKIERNGLYLLYIFSNIDSTSEALRKLFKEKREWIDTNYCPFFVEIQHAVKTGLLKLFEDSDMLPITPSIFIVEPDGAVQACLIGYGETSEFLTKGGSHG